MTSSLATTSDISGLIFAHSNSVAAGSGGAIYNRGSLFLTRCAVVENAGGSGGGVANEGTLVVSECTFALNTSTGNGGALRNTGSVLLVNSTFTQNLALSTGAISSFVASGPSAVFTITNCTIARNSATDPTSAFGGGIFNGSTSTAILYNTIVAGNFAPEVELDLARDLEGVAHRPVVDDEILRLAVPPLFRRSAKAFSPAGLTSRLGNCSQRACRSGTS